MMTRLILGTECEEDLNGTDEYVAEYNWGCPETGRV